MQDKTSDAGPDPIRPEDQVDSDSPHSTNPAADHPSDDQPETSGSPEDPTVEPPVDPTTRAATSDPSAATLEIETAATHEAGAHEAGAHEAEDHDYEESGGRSFAAWALIVLVLLLAGAGLALWGAPRLAPHLPSGMAPIAEWLTPGQQDAEVRIAQVETETAAAIEELRSALAEQLAAAPDAAALDAQFAELETALGERLNALSDDLAALQGAQGGERLAELEAAVEGQGAALASLRDQLSTADNVEGVTAQIDVYQSDLEGLRAEVRELSGQVGAFAGRLEEVAGAAERQISLAREQVAQIEAESAVALGSAGRHAALASIRSALSSGAPYAEAAAALAAETPVPVGLLNPAETGVPTMSALRDTFSEAAHEAIRASIVARAGDGIVARARAFAEAQVASRSLTPQQGSDTDAVLSRMEDALRRDDLAAALRDAESLPSEAATAMAPWLDQARTLAAAMDGYQTLDAQLSATN